MHVRGDIYALSLKNKVSLSRKNRSSSSEIFGRDMSSLYRELVFLILQFLNEEMFKDTVHRLEQESGFFFNMFHFEELDN